VRVRKYIFVLYSKKLYLFYLLCSFLTITNHGMKKTLKQREGQLKYALHNTKINASLRMTIYEILYLVTRT